MIKEDVKTKVRKWCEEEGLFDEEIEDPQAVFNYAINYPKGLNHKINIIQPKKGDDKVIVLSGSRFESRIVSELRNISREELDDLLWDIRISLCSRPTEFELKISEDSAVPESLFVNYPIFLDGLTKHRLMTAIRDVYKSKLLAFWKIRQRIGL